jgi:ADP-ribose pyrophosphatase YjhB (NUDIX family)
VEHGYDSLKKEHFCRPPGGALEFGERAVEALRREFLEEFHAELAEASLLTVLENIFTFEGQQHHEIAFVFEAQFRDPGMYERTEFEILDVRTTASWKSLTELAASSTPLYPEGLLAFLERTPGLG